MNLTEFFCDSAKPKYLKAGIYGSAGTGKTRTATEIAIGLVKDFSLEKPVLFFDTEKGADWVLPLFNKAGVKCLVKKSRTFNDLLKAIEIAENEASVLIIDSVSHVWRELTQAFLNQMNADRKKLLTKRFGEDWVNRNFKNSNQIEFQHWAVIKPLWAKFNDKYLNSNLHVIVCGRAGDMYEYQENENGKKELIKNGTRMATEKELSYEPSLLIETRRKIIDGREHLFSFVEKDRSDTINGMEFELAKYEHFKPHISLLKDGTDDKCSDLYSNSSAELFEGKTIEPIDEFHVEKKRCTVLLEEIEGLIKLKYPSQTVEDKTSRQKVMQQVFNTLSWTEITNMSSGKLEAGLTSLRNILSEL